MQQHLKETIDQALKPLQDILKSKEAHQQFLRVCKNFRIVNNVSAMQLNIPQTPASGMYLFNLIRQNMDKFRRFTQTVLNPANIAQLVSELDSVELS